MVTLNYAQTLVLVWLGLTHGIVQGTIYESSKSQAGLCFINYTISPAPV